MRACILYSVDGTLRSRMRINGAKKEGIGYIFRYTFMVDEKNINEFYGRAKFCKALAWDAPDVAKVYGIHGLLIGVAPEKVQIRYYVRSTVVIEGVPHYELKHKTLDITAIPEIKDTLPFHYEVSMVHPKVYTSQSLFEEALNNFYILLHRSDNYPQFCKSLGDVYGTKHSS